MSLSQVQSKRDAYLQTVSDYQQALIDFEDGTIDQSQLDQVLDATISAGKDYADQVGATSTEQGITDDELFSDATKLTPKIRDTVAKVVTSGRLGEDLTFLVFGGGNWLRGPDNTKLGAGGEATYTVAVVVDEVTNHHQNIFSHGAGGNGVGVGVTPDGKFFVGVSDGGNAITLVTSNFNTELGKSYRIDLRLSSSNDRIELWINGSKVLDVSQALDGFNGTWIFAVAGYDGGAHPYEPASYEDDWHFHGKIHRLGIWNTLIDKADLDSWWETGSNATTPAVNLSADDYDNQINWTLGGYKSLTMDTNYNNPTKEVVSGVVV